MDNLREVFERFNETKAKYNIVLKEHQDLRKKCDERLREEMLKLVEQLDEIAACGRILLETFHHYGDVIKFPITLYEDREDCIVFSITRDEYRICLNNDNNILYKSDLDIEDLPTSCYELLVINKDLVVDKASNQIKTYYDGEICKMNENIENENSYYDMLTRSLFPEEKEE